MDNSGLQLVESRSTASNRFVRLLVAFIILIACVGLILIAYNRFVSVPSQVQEKVGSVRSVTESDHVLGALDAPIKLIVYTDLECPYCQSFHQTTQSALLEQYGDELAIAFRHFPLPSRPKGLVEAEAAECAYLLGGHDAFWGFVNMVFAVSPSNNGLDLTLLPDMARRIGLNENTFEECRAEGGGSKRVQNDKTDGIFAGVALTPSFLVQGEERSAFVEGSYPDRIRAAIEYVRTASQASP